MTEVSKVQAAQEVADQAAQAAKNAADGAMAEFILSVTDKAQLKGKTDMESARNASKFISLRGYDAFVKLQANSAR